MAASALSNFSFIPRETLRYTPYDPSQFWRQVGNSNALGSLPNLLFLLGSTGMYAPRQTDKKPHIVFMMADDLGWNDVSFHGSKQVPTTNIDAIARDGIILNQYYVQPTCSPSRGSLMTGKYPIRLGLQHNVISATEPWGLSPKEKILPQYLKELEYSTHAVGKWHLGFFRENYLPLKRGFDSFFGYYSGVEDHFTHEARSGGAEGLDLHDNDHDAWQYNGTYGTDLYTEKATKIIQEHDRSQPLFLYFAQQAVHSGNFDSTTLQAPEKYVEPMIGIDDKSRKIFAGMVSALDHSVGEIFDALETSGMLDDTIFIFATDNGGAPQKLDGTSGSNWPLKGGKYTLWEGGVRGAAFVWSPLLRRQSHIHNDLMHISDWLPTLLSASGGPRALDLLPQDIDGVDQWPTLAHGLPSPRSEILLNIDDVEGTGAFRKGRFKLINGTAPCDCNQWYDREGKEYKATSLSSWRNPIREEMYESNYLRFLGHSKAAQVLLNKYGRIPLSAASCTTPSCHEQLEIRCEVPPTVESSCESEPCLYDIEADPCELYNIARQYPQVVSEMEKRIDYYRSVAVPPVYKPPDNSSDPKLHGGVWGPWR